LSEHNIILQHNSLKQGSDKKLLFPLGICMKSMHDVLGHLNANGHKAKTCAW